MPEGVHVVVGSSAPSVSAQSRRRALRLVLTTFLTPALAQSLDPGL